MNLLPSTDQRQIVDTLRSFLSEQASVSRLRPPNPQIGNDDARLWPRIGELGFLGVAIGDQHGGIGLGAAEEMLACREFGRHLLSPAVLAVTLAAHLAARRDAMDLLAELMAGRAAVGIANPRGPVEIGPSCSGDFHLIDGEGAPWILCCTEQGTALLQREQFVDVQAVLGTDNMLALRRASLRAAKPALWLAEGEARLHVRAMLLGAAYAVGMAEATRDMAVEYAKLREQFGKPIGSFQAVKHICADMAIRAEAALCQTTVAALVVDEDKAGAEFHVTAAKIVATQAALDNAASNIQVHGAFGFTSEADAHLFLKRAHVIDRFTGDLRRQKARLIDMPYPEAA